MGKLLFSILILVFQTDIYSLHYTSVNGTDISLSTFKGKKIMFVNVATNSSNAGQLTELEQLQEKYKDSLVVIVFPSNSFGNESRPNGDIGPFFQNNYHSTYLIAQKGSVKGTDIQPIYHWLTDINENGSIPGDILNDFQKYLVDKEGNLVGVFSPKLSPMNQAIQDAITAQ